MNPVRAIGRSTLDLLRTAGAVALFAVRGVLALLTPRWFLGQTGRQILAIGYFSLPVVGLTAVFTGAALALNIYTGGGRFNAEQIMPQIVALGITRELGPVLAALMLAAGCRRRSRPRSGPCGRPSRSTPCRPCRPTRSAI